MIQPHAFFLLAWEIAANGHGLLYPLQNWDQIKLWSAMICQPCSADETCAFACESASCFAVWLLLQIPLVHKKKNVPFHAFSLHCPALLSASLATSWTASIFTVNHCNFSRQILYSVWVTTCVTGYSLPLPLLSPITESTLLKTLPLQKGH